MKKPLHRDFKFWLNVFTILALAFLIYISRAQIVDALKKLGGLNLGALLMIIPIQLVSYYAVAKLYKIFFDAHGERIKFSALYKITLELNFINHVFPSGGVSGFSYLSLRLKRHGISTAESTLAQLLRFGLTFISFLLLLLLGLFMLAFNQKTSQLIILISSSIIFATIFGAMIAVFIISKSSRIKAFVSWLPRFLNFLFKFLRIGRKRDVINLDKVEATLEDLHQNYIDLRRDKKLIKRLLGWTLVTNIAEILTIYVVYIAFSTLINPGAVIIAYAVANFAGLIAILPGGVGVYEGLMTATLASAGIEKALALSATVVYRVLSMLFFLPIGYYYYHRAIRRGGNEFKEELKHLKDDTDIIP